MVKSGCNCYQTPKPCGYRNVLMYSLLRNLTVCCPSMMGALTQMCGFAAAGLGAWGCPQLEFAALCSCRLCLGGSMCALLKSAGKASVEVNSVRGPYVNHHMSSSSNKMYSILCFAWIPNGNKLV